MQIWKSRSVPWVQTFVIKNFIKIMWNTLHRFEKSVYGRFQSVYGKVLVKSAAIGKHKYQGTIFIKRNSGLNNSWNICFIIGTFATSLLHSMWLSVRAACPELVSGESKTASTKIHEVYELYMLGNIGVQPENQAYLVVS
jgi:hypothetical protein